MATISQTRGGRATDERSPAAKSFLALTGFITVVAVIWWFGFAGPPSMGTDEDVFKSVDALFTAVSSQDLTLVDQCAARLEELHTGGQLPEAPWSFLSGVIQMARDGRWEKSAQKLYGFVLAQRQEAAPHPKRATGALQSAAR